MKGHKTQMNRIQELIKSVPVYTTESGKEFDGTVFIYRLIDPRNEQIRYIGKTVNPLNRLKQHLGSSKNPHMNMWIDCLIDQNLIPKIDFIERTSTGLSHSRERFWINHYLSMGCDLINIELNIYRKKRRVYEIDLIIEDTRKAIYQLIENQ